MTNTGTVYCIDACSIIYFFDHFPKDIFNTLHDRVSDLLDQRRLLVHRLVKSEIAHWNVDAYAWCQSVPDRNLIDIDNEQGKFISRLELELPDYAAQFTHVEYQTKADPFLVACGHNHGFTVVTEEKNKPARIPFLCDHFGVDCIKLFDMF